VKMTHWIHCNVCASLPSKSSETVFYIGSCGHLTCGRCLLKDGIEVKSPQRGISGQCRVCNKRASYKAIDRDLPRDIQIFFQSPYSLMEKQSRQLMAVMKFQAEQQARFYKNVQMKQGLLFQQMQCLAKRAQVDAQVIEQKNREVEALKQHNNELEQRLKKEMQESKAARDKLNSTIDSQCTAGSIRSNASSLAQKFGSLGRPQSAMFRREEVSMSSTNSSFGSSKTPGPTRFHYRPAKKDPRGTETKTPDDRKSPFDLASRFNAFAPSTPSASNSEGNKPSTVVMQGRIATRGPLTSQGISNLREGHV